MDADGAKEDDPTVEAASRRDDDMRKSIARKAGSYAPSAFIRANPRQESLARLLHALPTHASQNAEHFRNGSADFDAGITPLPSLRRTLQKEAAEAWQMGRMVYSVDAPETARIVIGELERNGVRKGSIRIAARADLESQALAQLQQIQSALVRAGREASADLVMTEASRVPYQHEIALGRVIIAIEAETENRDAIERLIAMLGGDVRRVRAQLPAANSPLVGAKIEMDRS